MTDEQIKAINMLKDFKSNHKSYKKTNNKINSLISCIKQAKKYCIIDIYEFVIQAIQFLIITEKNSKVKIELAWLYNGCQYDFYCDF